MAINWELLADFFPMNAIHWKPQSVKGNRCLAIPYLTAHNVMDRLDKTVGVGCWRDSYTFLPNGSVVCRLEVFDGTNWIGKEDVGSQSDQPEEGDRVKAAVSDALKRAAVKFGIGRYLHEFPKVWVDYDPAKKQIPVPPGIPARFTCQSDREKMNENAKQPAKQSAPPQPTKQTPPKKPAVEEVRNLLMELAALRKIDHGSMFNIFAEAFRPGIKAVKDIPEDQLPEAAKQLRMKIEVEKRI